MSDGFPAISLQVNDTVSEKRQMAIQGLFQDKFLNKLTTPVRFIDDAKLYTTTSLHFYRHDFAHLSRQMFMEYQYRSWVGFNQDLLDRFNELCTTKLHNILQMLNLHVQRYKQLLQQNNAAMDTTVYPSAYVFTVPITSPLAATYFEVLQTLDRVHEYGGACALWGIIQDKERSSTEYQCKRAIRAMSTMLRFEVPKLQRESFRVMKEQKSPSQDDKTIESVVKMQDENMKNINAHADESHVSGEDASQAIDDAVAASKALVNAAKSKKAPKAAAAQA